MFISKELQLSSRSETDALIELAWKESASDLHLDPVQNGGEVKMRIDGFFHPLSTLSDKNYDLLIGRLRVLAHLPSYENLLPQEGRISADEGEIRVSIMPVVQGLRVVLRFLPRKKKPLALDDLGFEPEVTSLLSGLIDTKSGLIIVGGPSGSGKTTTLYAFIQTLTESHWNDWQFISIEDPVERIVPGLAQIEINHHVGFDFQKALKHVLRQDPEMIMVGEIRDPETAAIAVEAAYTGHLILATMHVGTGKEILLRLNRMGIQDHQVESTLKLLMNQRLVRKRCRDCTDGCPACFYCGYRGVIPVCETFDSYGGCQEGRRTGPSMEQQLHTLIDQGATTFEESERVLGKRI